MISSKLKAVITACEKAGYSGWPNAMPNYLLVDKETGEPKKSPKNMKLFGIVQMVLDLPKDEYNILIRSRATKASSSEITSFYNEIGDWAKQQKFEFKVTDLGLLSEVVYTYLKKLELIKAKKEKEVKKSSVAAEKSKLQLSLTRSDISKASSDIKKSIEPAIKKGEQQIKDSILSKYKGFNDDWNAALVELRKSGIEIIKTSVMKNDNVSEYMYKGQLQKNGAYAGQGWIPIKSALQNTIFGSHWFDRRTDSGMTTLGSFFMYDQHNQAIERTQKSFRNGEYHKVDALFYRLLKSNPTLKNYALSKPYSGGEFTLSATNELNEQIIITTNTIYAGGWNIQRYHARWLVDIRNTVTNKVEKFKLEDKDIK